VLAQNGWWPLMAAADLRLGRDVIELARTRVGNDLSGCCRSSRHGPRLSFQEAGRGRSCRRIAALAVRRQPVAQRRRQGPGSGRQLRRRQQPKQRHRQPLRWRARAEPPGRLRLRSRQPAPKPRASHVPQHQGKLLAGLSSWTRA